MPECGENVCREQTRPRGALTAGQPRGRHGFDHPQRAGFEERAVFDSGAEETERVLGGQEVQKTAGGVMQLFTFLIYCFLRTNGGEEAGKGLIQITTCFIYTLF